MQYITNCTLKLLCADRLTALKHIMMLAWLCLLRCHLLLAWQWSAIACIFPGNRNRVIPRRVAPGTFHYGLYHSKRKFLKVVCLLCTSFVTAGTCWVMLQWRAVIRLNLQLWVMLSSSFNVCFLSLLVSPLNFTKKYISLTFSGDLASFFIL